MQKWEYLRLRETGDAIYRFAEPPTHWTEVVKGHTALDKYLNTLGEQGWELAGTVGDNTTGVVFLFKRPKP